MARYLIENTIGMVLIGVLGYVIVCLLFVM